MVTKLEEYDKYQHYYEEYYRKRKFGNTGLINKLPRKPIQPRKIGWQYLAVILLLLVLLLMVIFLYHREQNWNTFNIENMGNVLAGKVTSTKEIQPPLSDREVRLCTNFNCRVYNSPWRHSYVTVDLYLKTDPKLREQDNEIALKDELMIKDIVRDVVSGADLYKIKDPHLTDIRQQLESKLGEIWGRNLSDQLLIPQWKMHF